MYSIFDRALPSPPADVLVLMDAASKEMLSAGACAKAIDAQTRAVATAIRIEGFICDTNCGKVNNSIRKMQTAEC